MINLMLSIWDNPDLLIKLLLSIAVVVIVVFLFIKFSGIRPIIYIVASVFILFFGITTTIENIRYLQLNNMTVGSVLDSTFKSMTYFEEQEPGEFKINNLGFKQINGDLWQTTINQPAITSLDFSNQEYVLYVNGNKCYLYGHGQDYLSAEFTYAFYDDDLELIMIDTLTINIALSTNESTLVIKTVGGLNAVELWKSYQVKNNFILKVNLQT